MKTSLTKKLLLLVMIAATTLLAVSGLSACSGDNYELEYTLSDDGTYYSVTGCSSPSISSPTNKDRYWDVVIPSTYKDLPVQEISGSVFDYSTILKSVVIPDSVTKISGGFYQCYSLTSVTIGSGVTEIGNKVFANCYKLVEVYNLSQLPIETGSMSYGYVGAYAKVVHTSLEEESILFTQDNYIFMKNGNSYSLMCHTVTSEDITLPELTVDGSRHNYSIYDCAFYGVSISSITIPTYVIAIGSSAFVSTNLTSVTFESTSGWHITATGSDDDTTEITVTDASQNATNLTKGKNSASYWYKDYLTGTRIK